MFESSTQPAYIILLRELKKLIAIYPKEQHHHKEAFPVPDEICDATFHGLGYTHQHDTGPDSCSCSRLAPPYADTFSWIFQETKFNSWLTESELTTCWIRGKPGSGKSTLTKYLVHSLERRFLDERSAIILHYFFDGRQHHLDHATTRLLVSLLQQVSLKSINTYTSNNEQEIQSLKLNWPDGFRTYRELLRQHLSRKLQSRSQVFLFVDGLDECSRDEFTDVIDLCKSLGKGEQPFSVKFFVTSREGFVPFGHEHTTFDLDSENRHSASTFIQHELTHFPLLRNDWQDIQVLLNWIQGQTEYNFLWMLLILLLLNLMSKGDGQVPDQLVNLPKTLEGTSKMLGAELYERYDDMLQSIPNGAQTLSWVALAIRPISSLEMETALSWIRCAAISETTAVSKKPTRSLDLAKRLSQSTGGMLRIFYSCRGSTIRVVHESVRDPLLQSRMKELSVPLSEISRGRSMVHLEMARTCLKYMLSNVATVRTADEFPSTILAQYPFLEYATSCWAAHAKAANSGSISDEEFLRYFPWPTDAEMNLVGLASSIIHLNFNGTKEKYSTFLHYAAYCGLDKPLRAAMSRRGQDRYMPNVDMRTCSGRTALHIAASMGHWPVVNYLLSQGANVHAKDTVYGNSILHWAALSPMSEGKVQSLEYLIQVSADINDNSNGMAPLALAVAYGDSDVVSALLSAGAHPDGMDRHRGLTALSLAIVHKQIAAISHLLDANACLEYGDIKTGLTPLEMAIATRQHDVVFMLLKKGAGLCLPKLQTARQDQGLNNQKGMDRMWLDRMLILFRDFARSAFVECPVQSSKPQDTRANQNSKATQHSSSSTSRKRTTRDEPYQHEEEGDDDEDHSKRPRHSSNLPEDEPDDDIYYHCPYYNRNKGRFGSTCRKAIFRRGRLHHILEHLKKVHYKSICGKCKEAFPSETRLKEHFKRNESCHWNETRNYEDGYDQEQYNELHSRKRGSEKTLGADGFLECICRILFKDYDASRDLPNKSRAVDIPQHLQGFETFIRQDLRNNSSLRQGIREAIGKTDEALETKIMMAIHELPGSFSERYLQQGNEVPAPASSGSGPLQPKVVEQMSTQTAAHTESSSEGERHPDIDASQPSLDTPRCDPRQPLLHSTSQIGSHAPSSIDPYSPQSVLTSHRVSSTYPHFAQTQTPLPNPNLPQSQHPAYSPWPRQPPPVYSTGQVYTATNNMTPRNPWNSSARMMGDNFISPNQNPNPMVVNTFSTPNQHPLPMMGNNFGNANQNPNPTMVHTFGTPTQHPFSVMGNTFSNANQNPNPRMVHTFCTPNNHPHPMMGNTFSSSNQHPVPIPFDFYTPTNGFGHMMGSVGPGGFDTLNAIRNQHTSTQSSYSASNMASELGISHTSATSQYQAEASDSGELDALQIDLYNAGLSELGPFPPGEPLNSASSPFSLDEEGDQENVEPYHPEHYFEQGRGSRTK